MTMTSRLGEVMTPYVNVTVDAAVQLDGWQVKTGVRCRPRILLNANFLVQCHLPGKSFSFSQMMEESHGQV